eukprot:UN27252
MAIDLFFKISRPTLIDYFASLCYFFPIKFAFKRHII